MTNLQKLPENKDELGICDLIRSYVPIESISSIMILLDPYDGSLFQDGIEVMYYALVIYFDNKINAYRYVSHYPPLSREEVDLLVSEFTVYYRHSFVPYFADKRNDVKPIKLLSTDVDKDYR